MSIKLSKLTLVIQISTQPLQHKYSNVAYKRK